MLCCRRTTIACLLAAVGLGVAWLRFGTFPAEAQTGKDQDAAVERTRKTVRMLDDIYKTAVVLITDKYVHDDDDFAAGSAAVALFDAIKKKGWHEVRLLDGTGKPVEDKNAPQDDFEKAAIKQLTGGQDYHEQIVTKDGKRLLRAATPIPVVSKKCIMCHEHYADAKEGAAIGALSYTIAIE